MKKLIRSKYSWLTILCILILMNVVVSFTNVRLDLTADKRYTLSSPTRNLLRSIRGKVVITVFLDGEMPAGFRKLRNSTNELLQEFRELAGNNLSVKFESPGAELPPESKQYFIDSLYRLGLRPTNVKAQTKQGQGEEQRLIFPGALIHYDGKEIAIDLLQGQSQVGGLQALNKAEALLEYKFASAIQKVTAEKAPVVGYLLGNGEPFTYNVFDLVQNTLKQNYGFSFVPIDSFPVLPPVFDALLLVKPTIPFSDPQKLKLDQYIMNGGRLIWLIDNLYAEMDSLRGSNTEYIAFDRNLNIEDLLFRYGVRINQDLVQDLQCLRLPMVINGGTGAQAQTEFLPWPYFPLLTGGSEHPVSKNLDNILSIFPNSIDTVVTPDLKKTVLLVTGDASRTLNTPAIVSWNTLRTEEDARQFTKKHIPVAVLLEGKFNSLYANRISKARADSLAVYGQPFKPVSIENKMIVVSDADIVTNVVTRDKGPLPMGFDQFTEQQYANKDFLHNCIEFLVNPSRIIETRSKDFALRLLDPAKTAEQKNLYQLINTVFPVALIIIFGGVYQFLRRKKYQGK
ncbi:MAG TPA: gliding motility-associated ABC transporter substrate-binding protein GldG [Flavitalea sp.]|nr:gliding motility-associated ABC transporter substrate-binding protein GldG [Flavitalea sp.]